MFRGSIVLMPRLPTAHVSVIGFKGVKDPKGLTQLLLMCRPRRLNHLQEEMKNGALFRVVEGCDK